MKQWRNHAFPARDVVGRVSPTVWWLEGSFPGSKEAEPTHDRQRRWVEKGRRGESGLRVSIQQYIFWTGLSRASARHLPPLTTNAPQCFRSHSVGNTPPLLRLPSPPSSSRARVRLARSEGEHTALHVFPDVSVASSILIGNFDSPSRVVPIAGYPIKLLLNWHVFLRFSSPQ